MSHDEDVRKPTVRELFVMLDYALSDLDEADPAHGYLTSLHRITDALMEEHEAIGVWRHAKQDDGSPVLPWIITDAHDKVEELLHRT